MFFFFRANFKARRRYGLRPQEQAEMRSQTRTGSFFCFISCPGEKNWDERFLQHVNIPAPTLKAKLHSPLLVLPYLDVPFDIEKTRRPRPRMLLNLACTDVPAPSSSSSAESDIDSAASSGYSSAGYSSASSSSSSDSDWWSYDEATQPRIGTRYQADTKQFLECV